jgi:hypothetical protein
MKIALQIVGMIFLLALIGAVTIWHNNYKHQKCIDMGGRFVINTTDATLSTCILEN